MHPPSLAQRPSPPLDAPTAHAFGTPTVSMKWRVRESREEGQRCRWSSSGSFPAYSAPHPPTTSPPATPCPAFASALSTTTPASIQCPAFPRLSHTTVSQHPPLLPSSPVSTPPTTVAKLRFRLLTDDAAPPPSLSHTLYPRSPDAAATRPRAHASTSKIPAKPCPSNHTAAALHSCAARPEFGHERTTQAFFPPPPRPTPPLASRRPTSPFTPKRAARTRSSKMRVTSLPRPLYPALPTPSTAPIRDLSSTRYAQAPGRLNPKIVKVRTNRLGTPYVAVTT
ncbi:hypothetical protein R3P38DRAFT_3187696 [Favolaschia claudopus]|uniref:Uncharacterized protein n=1 Tax=Favolaschia claudopus TaxID=2862362 RepID=A0AAW0C0T2_9AGAR